MRIYRWPNKRKEIGLTELRYVTFIMSHKFVAMVTWWTWETEVLFWSRHTIVSCWASFAHRLLRLICKRSGGTRNSARWTSWAVVSDSTNSTGTSISAAIWCSCIYATCTEISCKKYFRKLVKNKVYYILTVNCFLCNCYSKTCITYIYLTMTFSSYIMKIGEILKIDVIRIKFLFQNNECILLLFMSLMKRKHYIA